MLGNGGLRVVGDLKLIGNSDGRRDHDVRITEDLMLIANFGKREQR